VGVFNALEGLVTDYGGGYRWLLGPYDDVASFIDDYLRSAHLEEPTCAFYVDFSLGWLTHVRVMSSLLRLLFTCLDHSLV
jgi:hypothetical protein